MGLRDPGDACRIAGVPTSLPDTGARTARVLREHGMRVRALPGLTDVDTVADAGVVAAAAPGGLFADALRGLASWR